MPANTYNVIVDSGRVVAGSLTLGTVVPVLTTNHNGLALAIANTLDQDVWLTKDGANWLPLPAGQGAGLDLVRIIVPAGTVLGVLPISATPTSGWLGVVNL